MRQTIAPNQSVQLADGSQNTPALLLLTQGSGLLTIGTGSIAMPLGGLKRLVLLPRGKVATLLAGARGASVTVGALGASSAPPVAPSAPSPSQWSLTRGNGLLTVNVNSLPPNGGSAITRLEYRLNGAGSWISSGGVVTFNIAGLTNGTSYGVEIRAVNAVGNGAASASKSGTPATVPAAPSLTATPGNGQVSIAWTDGATGGDAITGHNLYAGATSGVLSLVGTISTASPYVDTGLTNGVPRFYQITALNGVGEGARSTEQSATPSAAVTPVTMVRNDALSRFDVANPEAFPSGTYKFFDEAGTRIGTIATPYILFSAVPNGKGVYGQANNNAATNSAIYYVEQDNTAFFFDAATEPDGALNGRHGITAHSSYVFGGGKLGVNAGDTTFSYPPGLGLKQRITTNILTSLIDFGDGSTKRSFFFLVSGDGNYRIQVEMRQHIMRFHKRHAGNYYDEFRPNISGDFLNGDELVMSIDQAAGRLQVLHKGVRIDGGGLGIDINADGHVMPANAGWFFEGPEGINTGNPTYPIPVMTTMRGEAVPAASITVTSTSFTDPTVDTAPIINFGGTTGYADLQAVVVSKSGVQLTPVASYTGLTIGAFALSMTMPPEAQGQNAFLRIRQTSNPANYIDHPLGKLPAYRPIARTLWGHQASNVATYSDEDVFTDRYHIMNWNYQISGSWQDNVVKPQRINGSFNMDAIPAEAEKITAKMGEGYYIGYGRGGQYLVSWTMNNVTAAWSSGYSAGITPGAINNVAKTALITLPDFTLGLSYNLEFTKTGGTVGDTTLTIVRVGETATGPINDKALASYIPGTVERWMKPQGVELPYPTLTDPPYLIDSQVAPPELIGLVTAQTGTIPYIVFPTNENTLWVQQYAARLKTTLPAGVRLYVEWGNEIIWNEQTYSASTSICMLRAALAGKIVGVAAGTVLVNDWTQAASYVNFSNGLVERVIAAGTKILTKVDNYQWVVVEAKTTLPIGFHIEDKPSGYETANYKILAEREPIEDGAYAYQTMRTAEIGDIFKAEFGSRNVIVPVMGCQLGEGGAKIAARLMADAGAYKGRIGLVVSSHYPQANRDWNSAESWFKDTSDANKATWQANFNAYNYARLGDMTNAIENSLTYYNILRDAGWTVADCANFGTYEGDLHASNYNIPYGAEQEAVALRIRDWKASTAAYDWTKEMLERVDALNLEIAVNFARHQYTKPRAGTVDNFGWLNAVNSQNHPVQGPKEQRWKAWTDFLAERAA